MQFFKKTKQCFAPYNLPDCIVRYISRFLYSPCAQVIYSPSKLSNVRSSFFNTPCLLKCLEGIFSSKKKTIKKLYNLYYMDFLEY